MKLNNYLYKEKRELENLYELEQIEKMPDMIYRHFMCFQNDVLYIVQEDSLYGLISVGDLIRAKYDWTLDQLINTRFSYIRDAEDEERGGIFEKYKNIYEIPIIRDNIFIGVLMKREHHTDKWWLSKRKIFMCNFDQRYCAKSVYKDQKDCKYILYGNSLEAEKFLYYHPHLIDEIKCCIASEEISENRGFHGIPIQRYEDVKNSDSYFIIVAVEWKLYEKVKQDLEKRELKEFEHFIWGSEYGKKIVLINANCHGTVISYYLNKSRQFLENYCIHPFSQIQENKEKKIECELLKRIDVYIHQDIRPENKISYELSDEFIRPLLKKGCLDITIPNMVGMGHWMFPTQCEYLKSVATSEGQIGVLYKDVALDEAYFHEEINGLKDYVEYYNAYSLDDTTLEELYEQDFHKLKLREKHWDIKISDYIEDHIKTVPCFVDQSHPSGHVLKEIVRRLATYLGIGDVEVSDNNCPKLGLPTPVLNCVKKHYKFQWNVPNDTPKNMLSDWKTDDELKEYIKEYMWCFYEKKLKL